MGWLRGDLRCLALVIGLAATPAGADAPPGGLSPEDEALLREIELVLMLELLETWDPKEDLPIPVSLPAEEPEDGDPEGAP